MLPIFPLADKLSWTKDGRALLLAIWEQSSDGNSGATRIMRVPIDGGAPYATGLDIKGNSNKLSNFTLSGDNSRFAYSGLNNNATEVWALENVSSIWRTAR
jgi:hypothetical protein